MPNQIGRRVKIYGMNFHISDVTFDANNRPVIFLKREFDNSIWYTQCRNVNRFTHIKRVPDFAHIGLDVRDVMNLTDITVRRI